MTFSYTIHIHMSKKTSCVTVYCLYNYFFYMKRKTACMAGCIICQNAFACIVGIGCYMCIWHSLWSLDVPAWCGVGLKCNSLFNELVNVSGTGYCLSVMSESQRGRVTWNFNMSTFIKLSAIIKHHLCKMVYKRHLQQQPIDFVIIIDYKCI